jgi:hypothetical protein
VAACVKDTAFSCLPLLNHRLSNSNDSGRELSRHRDKESLAFRHSRALYCDESSERGRDLVDSHNSNPIETPEMNRESLQVTAIAFLVLIGMAAPSAVPIVGLPKGRKPA